jgi:hypothetical protein
MFTKLSDHGIRIRTYSYPGDNIGDIFVGRAASVLDLEAKALSTRGWTFQEILVSIASLHYTDGGMVWECTALPESSQSMTNATDCLTGNQTGNPQWKANCYTQQIKPATAEA